MPTLIIDGKEINVKKGATIMEAARLLGVAIPHFCYHPKLSVSGNCRMCLVEVEKMPKPVVSCAMPVNDGMVVRTDSEMVRSARRGVMEFLLINHPLDCPVCDQGGECSLQDLAMKYGPDRSRYHEAKRQTPNHDLGPLIETEMNRCIHCTRCIRFSAEIAGTSEMGAIYRGDHMAVGPFVQGALASEMAGNMAEICPVGALNLKPFHFQARGWELQNTETVCGHCAVGCQTRTDHLNGQVKRVMARRCDPINEAWICDKGRFAYDGLTAERFAEPMARSADGGALAPVSWAVALDRAADILKGVKPEEVAGLADDGAQGAEELFAFQDFLRHVVGTPHLDHRIRQRDFSGDDVPLTRADLLMNTPLADLPTANVVVLVGCDPRFEAPLLNLRLRQAAQAGAAVYSVNPRRLDGNLPGLVDMVVAPGAMVGFLGQVLKGEGEGDARTLAQALKGAGRPVVLLGNFANNHPEAEAIRRQAVALMQQADALGASGAWNGFNRLSARGNAVAAQDLGVVPHRGPGYRRLESSGKNAAEILRAAADGGIKVLFLLGGDPLLDCVDTTLARAALDKAQVIYLGAQRTASARSAEVVLAGLSPAEKDGILTNCEGRAQRSRRAVMGPVQTKEDWRILRALSDRFANPLGYNTPEALGKAIAAADHRYDLAGMVPGDLLPACDHSPVTVGLTAAASAGQAGSGLLLVLEPSFHRDDPVARRSGIMAHLDRGNRVRINPKDAAGHKVQQGRQVRLIQGERSVELTAELDQRVPEGLLFALLGYGDSLAQDLADWHGGYPRVSLVSL